MGQFYRLKKELVHHNPNVKMVKFNVEDLVFEERVKLKCFYCSKYDTKWTCPPRLPRANFKRAILEYKNSAIVVCGMKYTDKNYQEIREKTTNELHRAMLFLEKKLWDLDNPMVLTFIGGSCKLCKNGCAIDKCRNPSMKRIPMEATKINVIESLKKININVSFTKKDKLYRFGLLLW